MTAEMKPFDLPEPPAASVQSPVMERTQSVVFYHGGEIRCECVLEFGRGDPERPERCLGGVRRGAFGYVSIPSSVRLDLDLLHELDGAAHWGITYPTTPFFLTEASDKHIAEIHEKGCVGFDCQHLHDHDFHRTERYVVERLVEMAEILRVAKREQTRGIGRAP